jgi:hypothetical protein
MFNQTQIIIKDKKWITNYLDNIVYQEYVLECTDIKPYVINDIKYYNKCIEIKKQNESKLKNIVDDSYKLYMFSNRVI